EKTDHHALAATADGKVLATYDHKEVTLWDAARGKKLRTLGGEDVTAAAFAPDGKTLATGHHDGWGRLWAADTGKQLRAFRGHLVRVNAVAFSPDGRRLASASDDTTALVWDLAGK